MSRLLSTAFFASLLICLSGCDGDDQKPRQHPYGYHPKPGTTYQEETPSTTGTSDSAATNDVGEVPAHTDSVKPSSGSGAPAAPPARKDYPYGTPVPNKPGYVTSPHAPYAGYVDVRGYPPGTEVKDPYTGKVFLVP